ncbi:hypothetical protein BH11PLA1_BH11PLA1_06240 [soil metagenome]
MSAPGAAGAVLLERTRANASRLAAALAECGVQAISTGAEVLEVRHTDLPRVLMELGEGAPPLEIAGALAAFSITRRAGCWEVVNPPIMLVESLGG